MPKHATKNENVVSVRFPEDMLKRIKQYAELKNTDVSKVIRMFIKMGMTNKVTEELMENFHMEQDEMLVNYLAKNKISCIRKNPFKNIIIKRDEHKCRKCGSIKDLIVYHIDKDPLNKSAKSRITLCKTCREWAEKYSPQRRVVEDFVEWFYLL